MEELILTQLIIYPVKSLGGISLTTAIAGTRGLQYDRRWLIVDNNNNFLTQRELPLMALIGTRLEENDFVLFQKHAPEVDIRVPLSIQDGTALQVRVWEDVCTALHWSEAADRWLSDFLKTSCKLVYMPDSTNRYVDKTYAHNNEIVNFADGYPFLIIGEASLNALNQRLEVQIPMNRFRPNFVFKGGEANCEDTWSKFRIGDVQFSGVKPCGRCPITTIDQDLAVKSKEPLKTLSTYRSKNNKVLFGQNLLALSEGKISVGDTLIIEKSIGDYE
ncbi:MAG: MOSC domain-containing protein [Bacteroidetes bacterium]|nr:MOSC domain-containing protein [Bacteroidota bacterium]MBK9672185.1 MOSC domain-containing protein [Bacteroidota bacterium]MBK9799668.1 MOSC domain-containing protein [Bacteroidota bacterium]MBP6413273.1 MOSC domain-containing protein [Bacteroidia bacterium]